MTLRKHVGRRLTDDQEAFLYGGGGILTGVDLETTFGTIEAAKAAWMIHGERITAESDLKPWGWWQWTATEAEKEQERALQRQRHSQSMRDPVDNLVPLTRRLVVPHLDGNGNGHPT